MLSLSPPLLGLWRIWTARARCQLRPRKQADLREKTRELSWGLLFLKSTVNQLRPYSSRRARGLSCRASVNSLKKQASLATAYRTPTTKLKFASKRIFKISLFLFLRSVAAYACASAQRLFAQSTKLVLKHTQQRSASS